MQSDEETDYSKPVAYDHQGRPLYAHPPAPSKPHVAEHKSHETIRTDEEITSRHIKSVKRYPGLNLSKNEYVIAEIKRHPAGLIIPIGFCVFLLLLMAFWLTNYSVLVPTGKPAFGEILLPVSALAALVLVGAYVIAWVYTGHRMLLTNESIIQETQHTLFAHHEQTVGLGNVEDVSYMRHGIMQVFFNYGTIRMSTEGEETTYTFPYVGDPKKEVAVIHNAIESFKHGKHPGDD